MEAARRRDLLSVGLVTRTLEARVGPALRVLDLHDVAGPVGNVGRAAVPALVVCQVDVARPAEHRRRAPALERRGVLGAGCRPE